MADLLEAARSAEHAAQLKLDEEAGEAVATALNGTVGSSSDDSDGGDISGAAPLGGAIGAAPAPAISSSSSSRSSSSSEEEEDCLLYTSPSPRDKRQSRMPSSA